MAEKYTFIELKIDGKMKKFPIKEEMTMGDTMRAMKLGKKLAEQGEYPIEALEDLFAFVVRVFEDKFTIEELEEGIPAGLEGFKKLEEVIQAVSNGNVEDEKK